MRFAAPVRAQLGIPTVFNVLGPLANPARATRQLVGLSDPAMASTMAEVLGTNGSRHSMVVYADDGLDELSVTSPSTVMEVIGDGQGGYDVRTWRLDPVELGFAQATMDDLRGGDAAFNAGVIRGVLNGDRGPRRDIGVLNAAAALVIVGNAVDLSEGVAQASASLDSGRAAKCSTSWSGCPPFPRSTPRSADDRPIGDVSIATDRPRCRRVIGADISEGFVEKRV